MIKLRRLIALGVVGTMVPASILAGQVFIYPAKGAVVASAGHAEPEDQASLICSTTHTVECDGTDEECHQGQGDTINFPRFFRVDFRKREMHILDPGRRDEVNEDDAAFNVFGACTSP